MWDKYEWFRTCEGGELNGFDGFNGRLGLGFGFTLYREISSGGSRDSEDGGGFPEGGMGGEMEG